MRWARLSERPHLPAAGLSIDTRAVLLPDEGDRAVGSSPSLADLSPSFSSMSATLKGDLEGVPGILSARNVDHAEKTSAGA